MEIQPFKMEVNPSQSRIVQKILFTYGYQWINGTIAICKENKPYLFFDKWLFYGDIEDFRFFHNYELPQITFDEFIDEFIEKYITLRIKEEPMNEEKKIVGYRPKPDAPIEAINAIAVTHLYNTRHIEVMEGGNDCKYYYTLKNHHVSISEFKRHGVLDLWFDPVYENKLTKHVVMKDNAREYDFYVYSPKSVNVYKNNEYIATVSLRKVRMLQKHLENQIKIHGFQFKIDNDAEVGFGCVKMSFEHLKYAIDNILDGEEE